MATVIRRGRGRISTANVRVGDIVIGGSSGGVVRGQSSGGGGGSSTLESPTPSASDLTGSAKEKEAQIKAFRSGGQQAFERLKSQQAEQRRAEEQRRQDEQRQAEQRRVQEVRTSKRTKRTTPFTTFVKRDIPFITKDVFKTFVPHPKDRQAIKDFVSKVQNKGDVADANLNKINKNIREFLDPEEKRIREESERIAKEYERQQDLIDRNIANFNKKFGGKELTEKDFAEAQKISKQISTNQAVLNLRISETEKATQRLKRKIGSDPTTLFRESIKGIATSPFTLTQSGIRLTRTKKEVKETIKSFKALPSEFSKAPFTILGSITGQVIGTGIISATVLSSLRGVTSTKALVSSKKSFILEKAPKGLRKTPLSKTFPRELKFTVNDKAVRSFARKQFKKNRVDFDRLTNIEKNFIEGQIKAQIRASPQKFIPQARKIALRKAKIKNIKGLIQDKLSGKFDKPIVFQKVGKKVKSNLSSIQKQALKRLSKNLSKQRIKKATIQRLDKPLSVKTSDLILSSKDKAQIVSRLKARVRADPKLLLTKSQKLSLKRAKTSSEISRVRKAVIKGRKKVKIKTLDLVLSKSQKSLIKSQLKAQIRASPKRFIPKQRKLVLKRLAQSQSKKAIQRAIKKGRNKVKTSDLVLSKQDKSFIRGQLKAQARASPQKFVTGARGQALIQIQRSKVKLRTPKIEIVSGKPTSIQRLAIKRLKKIHKQQVRQQVNLKKLNRKISVKQKSIQKLKQPQQIQKTKTKLRTKEIEIDIEKLKQTQKQAIRKLKQKQILKKPLKTKLSQVQRTKFIALTKTKQRQQVKQMDKQIQKLKQAKKQAESFASTKTLTKQKIIQKQNIKQATKLKEKIRQLKKQEQVQTKRIIPFAFAGRLKRKKKITIKKSKKGFDVFARPLKRRGQKRKPRLIKVNRVPLTKSRARDLRNKILDTSLARTGKIKRTRGKPQRPKLRVAVGFASRTSRKFRRFRRVKGRKKSLTKGKVIERKTRLLDTAQEKRGITLRRRIAQLTPKKRKRRVKKLSMSRSNKRKSIRLSKTSRRNSSPRRTTSKRTLSSLQLSNLAKGRAKRLSNLNKR